MKKTKKTTAKQLRRGRPADDDAPIRAEVDTETKKACIAGAAKYGTNLGFFVGKVLDSIKGELEALYVKQLQNEQDQPATAK